MRTNAYSLVLEMTSLEDRIGTLSDKLIETENKSEIEALNISINNLQRKYDKIKDRLEDAYI